VPADRPVAPALPFFCCGRQSSWEAGQLGAGGGACRVFFKHVDLRSNGLDGTKY
jgi:hypothetical protein